MRWSLMVFGLLLCVFPGVTTQEKTDLCEDLCQGQESRYQCYEIFLHVCIQAFEQEMANINSSDWCIWDQMKSPYNKFTTCTELMAECVMLPWPNRLVEETFVEIHSTYFQKCPTETLRDPPPNVVFALVMTPICLIPAMVVLVVLKTKNGDRRS